MEALNPDLTIGVKVAHPKNESADRARDIIAVRNALEEYINTIYFGLEETHLDILTDADQFDRDISESLEKYPCVIVDFMPTMGITTVYFRDESDIKGASQALEAAKIGTMRNDKIVRQTDEMSPQT